MSNHAETGYEVYTYVHAIGYTMALRHSYLYVRPDLHQVHVLDACVMNNMQQLAIRVSDLQKLVDI